MSATPATESGQSLPDGYRYVAGSERKPARGARRVNPADPGERLTVSVYVRRNPGAPPLDEFEHWMETPPGRRRFLTRQQMADAYGAAEADLEAVTQFGRNHGLAVTEKSVARRMVALTGTVRQMNDAFAVDLGRYESSAGGYRGREGPVHLPSDVADVVVGVFGLDDRPMARRASNGTGPPGASTLTPPQVAKLYNFPAGSAAGQTIGILEFGGGYDHADIKAFFSGLGQATPKIHAVSVDGVTNSPTGDPKGLDSEVVLDIDVAGSVGVGANIAVYFAPVSDRGWADAITKAVLEPAGLPGGWAAPSVLTCSWGFTELEADAPTGDAASPWPFEWTQQAINLVSGTYQQAAMMGVTIFNCSFDNGSNQQQNDGSAHVAYPGSDPWVTTCGGTRITNVAGSAFTESTWNDDAYQTGSATGGGISDAIDLPAWQQDIVAPSVNPGGRIGRGLPDIAGNASYYSGYLLQVDGKPGVQINGTSSVAPLYAGLIAIINATLGRPVGYLNPTLYALAQNPAHTGVIRDINDGISNAVRWVNQDGTTGGPSLGYASGAGWDACTGLGVLDGTRLLEALKTLTVNKVAPNSTGTPIAGTTGTRTSPGPAVPQNG
jgi:kumamolisin